jgi:hypothetical protein
MRDKAQVSDEPSTGGGSGIEEAPIDGKRFALPI